MRGLSRSSVTLTVVFVVAVLLLTTINTLTKNRIKRSEQTWTLNNLSHVLPPGPFDNDPVATQRQQTVPALGGDEALTLYTVYKSDEPAAAAMEIIARNGYNGDIRVLLGIRYNGEIVGARVLSHRETPGLADDIDIRRSDWITHFNGHSLAQLEPQDWDVKQRAGQFDAFTGATITPRAIISAIHQALIWFEANREQVFTR
jgi:electron transport complex protein RnfG